MKKVIYLLLAGVMFYSCSKLEDLSDSVQQNTQQCILPDVIYASDNNETEGDAIQSRTYVENNKYVVWHGDDAISYFTSTNHNVKYQYNGEDGVNNANFNLVQNTGSIGTDISSTYAVYPYSSTTAVFNDNGVEKLVVTYPNQQNYAPNSFGKGANIMVSAGNNLSDNNLYFRNACGYLIVKLYGEGVKVKNIKLTALGGEKLSGKAHIVAKQDAAPLVEMGSGATSTVTLDCGKDGVALSAESANATKFWFALPPVTFENGLQIAVTDTDGRLFKMQTTKKVVITRNDIQPMAALQFENNIPGNNMLWYTTTSGNPVNFNTSNPPFSPSVIIDHDYDINIGKYYIKFADDLKTILDNAFAGKDITSITLPQSLVTIEEEAFYQCKDLTSITIPGSVEKIGYSAFWKCTSLHTVNFEESDADLEIGCAYTSTLENLIGPFYYSPLETIILNRELVYKDKDGDALTATDADEGIFCIEKSCASGDGIETSFIIGEKVKTIPNYMLAKLGMKSLVIPGNVTRIGNNNFELCYELNSIKFLPDSTPLTIGYIDKAIDKGPFYDCELELIDLNRELNYLNDGPGGLNARDEGVFARDTNWGSSDDSYMDGMGEQPDYITKVNLGPNVKEISDWMFAGAKVELIWIPREITKIGKEAFYKCRKLKGLTCNHITPPTLGEDAFDGTKFEEENAAYIAVLKGSEEAFKQAPGWSEYADKIRTWEP